MSLRNANGNEIRRQLEEGNGDSHTKTKRFERSVLYGLVGLAWGLLAPAPVSAASIATIAEWQGYSNGVDAGGVGEFVPDKGFTSLHVDELDLAFNASGSPVDDVIILQFTATYKDGSTSPVCGMGADLSEGTERQNDEIVDLSNDRRYPRRRFDSYYPGARFRDELGGRTYRPVRFRPPFTEGRRGCGRSGRTGSLARVTESRSQFKSPTIISNFRAVRLSG
jgi:hypothetical protein